MRATVASSGGGGGGGGALRVTELLQVERGVKVGRSVLAQSTFSRPSGAVACRCGAVRYAVVRSVQFGSVSVRCGEAQFGHSIGISQRESLCAGLKDSAGATVCVTAFLVKG